MHSLNIWVGTQFVNMEIFSLAFKSQHRCIWNWAKGADTGLLTRLLLSDREGGKGSDISQLSLAWSPPIFSYPYNYETWVSVKLRTTKCTLAFPSREKFLQEVNSLTQKPSHPLAKTKTLVKSLMNRAELLLHVTIAAQSGLTRSISGTPAETPGTKPALHGLSALARL